MTDLLSRHPGSLALQEHFVISSIQVYPKAHVPQISPLSCQIVQANVWYCVYMALLVTLQYACKQGHVLQAS